MTLLVIETTQRRPAKDFEALARELESLDDGYTVRFGYVPESGGGTTGGFVDFVALWLPQVWQTVGEPAFGAVVGAVTAWALDRLKEKREAKAKEGRINDEIVLLVGPYGKPLKEIVVKAKDNSVELRDPHGSFDGKTLDMPPIHRNPPPGWYT